MIPTKNNAIIGNKSPSATWANKMIGMGLKPIEANRIPLINTTIHINLNFKDLKLLSHPNIPEIA